MNFFRMLLALLVFSATAEAAVFDIQVLGLFRDAVMLDIGGNQQLLRVGEVSGEGVLLVSANSKQAIVEVEGRSLVLSLSDRVSSRFETPTRPQVTIGLNNAGQYTVAGTINGQLVNFLVDTGATIVALNSNLARRLGLRFESGKIGQATTAGGMVTAYQIKLDSVQVGDIRIPNVQAAVLEGEFPPDVLLGMTFLRNVEIQESAGLMLLTGRL